MTELQGGKEGREKNEKKGRRGRRGEWKERKRRRFMRKELAGDSMENGRGRKKKVNDCKLHTRTCVHEHIHARTYICL